MNTRRVVLAAVLAFVLAWGTLVGLAVQKTRHPTAPRGARVLSRAEVARHDRPEDCWLVIRGKVYDVSDYIAAHPAPPRTITEHCGEESTTAFETKERGRSHSPQAWQLLESYLVGEVAD
ncbi:cytochrome b5 domain-containing protein [Polyangium spumosum]|uniref:Cytochrome b5 domain-containing protein n=1 Tax=Polyangium spumosum TaxID=889282 RepID=A0A6N7Q6D9_9BACT|nr:cytochrome b5-like heme/steroid binding domain-containing protein [Polyangium spumosum]MRG97864.1 cytochrome b5 domain-containing protein [Polyangium spumosum]